MRNCFVPHCDAFCKKNGITKRMMFSAPKDNFWVWKNKLFNKREFRETDRVCERHFDKGQILTHSEHIIDGKVCQLEREKPKIRANAIPHLNLPETESTGPTKKRANKQEPRKRKQNITANHKGKVTKKETQCEAKCEPFDDCAEPNERIDIKSDEEKRQIFDTVYDDIYEVVLPTMSWGIHRDQEDRRYIAFTMFDAVEMKSTTAVKLSDNFHLNVFVNGKQQTSKVLNNLSIDIVSKLLSLLNNNSDIDKEIV